MPKIHAIRTGLVKVRTAQMQARRTGAARVADMLFDEAWSDWLPIYTWLIDHGEGPILVDTGETARVHDRGYHPSWHPFYRRAVQFSVHRDEEIGPQLRALGVSPRDVRQVVLTHLHTDHAGGLMDLTGSTTWVAGAELRRATGMGGRVQGYLPHRWPRWWSPRPVQFENRPVGPFGSSMSLTRTGDVLVIPTPGHTPGHLSVLVSGSPSYLLAGDTSYNQTLLLSGRVDGVSPDAEVSRATMRRILTLARERPLVYLPSHDPESERRLRENATIMPDDEDAVCVA